MVWKEFVSVFAQELLGALLPVLAALLAAWLIGVIKKLWIEIKSRMDSRFTWTLDEAVRIAVLAAEQAKLGGYIKDKKTFAIGVAERWLESRGFKLDLDILDARIEAAVMEQFNQATLGSSGVTEPMSEV